MNLVTQRLAAESSTGLSDAVVISSLAMDWVQEWNPFLSSKLGLVVADEDYHGEPRNDDFYELSGGLYYQETRDSNIPLAEYEDSVFSPYVRLIDLHRTVTVGTIERLSGLRHSSMQPGIGRSLWLVLFLALSAVNGAVAGAEAGPRIGAGDKVRINVFGEDDLSVSERVSDRGTIAYPLLGELRVANMTPAELQEMITSRLRGPYLVDPRVTVSIEEYREFFVMGQVNRPGGYAYQPGLTIRKAISIAGGYTDRASRTKVFLVFEGEPGKEQRVGQDDPFGPGDTIVVKESLF